MPEANGTIAKNKVVQTPKKFEQLPITSRSTKKFVKCQKNLCIAIYNNVNLLRVYGI